MIITAEVLDRPRISFLTKSSECVPADGCPLKRPMSPSFQEYYLKKKPKAVTEIATFPQMTAAVESKTRVATASVFLSPLEDASNSVSKLQCSPFIVTATLMSSNLRVEPKIRSSPRGGAAEHLTEKAFPGTGQQEGRLGLARRGLNSGSESESSQRVNKKTWGMSKGNFVVDNKNEPKSKNNLFNCVGASQNSIEGSSPYHKPEAKVLGNNANTHNTKRVVNNARNEFAKRLQPSHAVSFGQPSSVNRNDLKSCQMNVTIKPINQNKTLNNKNKATITNNRNATPAKLNTAATPDDYAVLTKLGEEFKDLKKYSAGPSGSGGEENRQAKGRNNSIVDTFLRLRNNSWTSSKRPSIGALQENSTFVACIKSRNNSLMSGELFIRNNSLTNVLNFRPGCRNNSVSDSSQTYPTCITKAPLSSKSGHQHSTTTTAATTTTSNTTPRRATDGPVRGRMPGTASPGDGSKRPSKRMGGKTTVTTETRTYQRDGKWFEETVETTTLENKDGTRTTKKTTTKQLPGPPGAAGARRRSRSRSSSPEVTKTPAKDSSSGLLSRLKGRTKRSSSSSSDDEDDFDKKFGRDVLEAMNAKRSQHGVKALKKSKKLTEAAQQWARNLATLDKMQHKQDNGYGENIYRLTANMAVEKNVASATDIVSHWYGEVDKHKFGEEPDGKLESGHFTQMVWKDTREAGVGIALSNTRRNIYVVAFFSPKGNFMGEFATQVPPVGGFPHPSALSSLSARLRRASISSSSSSDDEDNFNDAVLKAHNEYRAKHGVPPLKLSKQLNKYATEWAKTIAKKDRMEHRQNNEYGENIYAKWNSKPNHTIPGKEPVESWYSEVKDHIFGREPKTLATGHFTQVVWRDTTELGVGLARNKSSGKLYVVCNYCPAGNFMTKFAEKVPRPL